MTRNLQAGLGAQRNQSLRITVGHTKGSGAQRTARGLIRLHGQPEDDGAGIDGFAGTMQLNRECERDRNAKASDASTRAGCRSVKSSAARGETVIDGRSIPDPLDQPQAAPREVPA